MLLKKSIYIMLICNIHCIQSDNFFEEEDINYPIYDPFTKIITSGNNSKEKIDKNYMDDNEFYILYLIDIINKNPDDPEIIIKLIYKLQELNVLLLMIHHLISNNFIFNENEQSIILPNNNTIIFKKSEIEFNINNKKFLFTITQIEYDFIIKLLNFLIKFIKNNKYVNLLKFFTTINLQKYITIPILNNNIQNINNSSLISPLNINKIHPNTISKSTIKVKKKSYINNKPSKNNKRSENNKKLKLNTNRKKKKIKIKVKKK